MRFVVDAMLGNVARDLRLLGYDAAYAGPAPDGELLRRCQKEARTLITRDRELARRARGLSCVLVSAAETSRQTPEVLQALGAAPPEAPLSRCLECNGPLRAVSLEEARPSLPDHLTITCSHFFACSGCGRVYWEGSHRKGLRDRIRSLATSLLPTDPPV